MSQNENEKNLTSVIATDGLKEIKSNPQENITVIGLSPNLPADNTLHNKVEESENNIEIEELKPKPKKKKTLLGKSITILLIVVSLTLLIGAAWFTRSILSATDKVIVNEGKDSCTNFLDINCYKGFNPFKPDETVKLKGQDEGRTNILVLGTDSEAGLTDSILLVSVYHKENKIVTLNFPRDLFVNASYKDNYGITKTVNEKINALYPFAQRDSDKPGAGAVAVSEFLAKEFNIPIHYWVTENFQGVEKVVDELGGINVNVDIAFTDCQFPNKNYTGVIRPCPSFKTGSQEMNGERALIYARSRLAPDDGGDFARSRRQMLVIQAMTAKAKEKGIFGNISNIQNYLNILGDTVRTNLSIKELLSLYKFVDKIDTNTLFEKTVWEFGNGFLCPGSSEGGRGSNIVYCGGYDIGSNNNSPSKKRAQNFVSNMLFEAQSSKLYQAKVGFLGNFSDDTYNIKNEFANLGFDNLNINNSYTKIPKATATSKEETTIYIPNDETRALFEKLPTKPKGTYKIEKTIPESRMIPINMENSDIIVWVQSM